MDLPSGLPADVLAFIEAEIESVPHMEALLLLWQSAPEPWTVSQVASRLYVGADAASRILCDLVRRRLLRAVGDDPQRFIYDTSWDTSGELMAKVAAAYRQHLILVAQVIHTKASGAVREFARAFEIKKKDG